MAASANSAQGLLFRKALKGITGVHIALYRASGGRIAGKLWGLPIVLLTTTGRKSGRARTTPLCALAVGDGYVVVASNGGRDWYPAWWLNLLAEPHATVQRGRTRTAMTARQATPEERTRLWEEITGIAPGYLDYERRTAREIPLGVFEPTTVAA